MIREKDAVKFVIKLLLCGVCAAVFVMALLFAKPTTPPDQEVRDAQAGENMPFESLGELKEFLGSAVTLPEFEGEVSSFSAYLYFADNDRQIEKLSSLSAHYFFADGSVCDLTIYPGREDAFDIPLEREYLRQNELDICCVKTGNSCALYFEADGDAYRLALRGADEPLSRLLAAIGVFGEQES